MLFFYFLIDVFIFLSVYEFFGNVLVEVLFIGVFVLISEVFVFKEIYGEEKDFVLGDFRDYKMIFENFKDCLINYLVLVEKGYVMIEIIQE